MVLRGWECQNREAVPGRHGRQTAQSTEAVCSLPGFPGRRRAPWAEGARAWAGTKVHTLWAPWSLIKCAFGMFLLLSPAAQGSPCHFVSLFLSLWTQPPVVAGAAGQEPPWGTHAFQPADGPTPWRSLPRDGSCPCASTGSLWGREKGGQVMAGRPFNDLAQYSDLGSSFWQQTWR